MAYVTRLEANNSLFGIPLDAVAEELLSPEARKHFGILKHVERDMLLGEAKVTFVSYDGHKFALGLDEMYAIINTPSKPRIGIERIQNPPTHDHQVDAYAMYFNIDWNTETAALPEKINTFILAGNIAEARYLAEEILGIHHWVYINKKEQIRGSEELYRASIYIYGTAKLRDDYREIKTFIDVGIHSAEQITDMTE